MSYVRVEREGPVAVMILDRPPVNAIDLEILKETRDTLAELGSDGSVGSIVVTGAGRVFCAGVDLKVVPAYDLDRQHEYIGLVNEVMTMIFGAPGPTIAAVNGAANAGGFILMLCCDYRMASRGDYPMGVTEAQVGIPFPISTLEVLRQELSHPVFRRLLLTGANHPPAKHLEWGVLDEVVEPERLMGRAVEMAKYMAGLPKGPYNAIKRQVRGATVELIESVISEGEPMLESWITDEGMRGAAGMMERVKEQGGRRSIDKSSSSAEEES